MHTNETETVPTPPAKGPGEQLRQARLALKLAPEDVAQILHLSPRQIVALESDDYAHLPGPTYVRGYLRGYAQLLGLAPETIVAAYGGLPAAKPKVDLTKLAPEPQLSSDHQGMLLATVGVLALVFGLAVVWWLGREDAAPKPVPVAVGQPPNAVESVATPVGGEAPAEGAEVKPTANPVPQVPATPGVPPPRTISSPAAAKPTVPVAPAAPAATVTAAETRASDTTVPPKPAVPAGPRERLVLTATADSWVDVRDALQNKLLYETLRPGQTVTIEGRAPISVFLGNADAVTLEYNGKPFDIKPHKRGVFARFNLAAPAAPAPASAPEAVDGTRQQ